MAQGDLQPLRIALEPPPSSSSSSSSLLGPASAQHHRQQPLSERLHRLWTERGDFSQFSLADLKDEDDADASEGQKALADGSGSAPVGVVKIGWGPGEEDGQQGATSESKDGAGDGPQQIDTSPMSVEEFVKLKEDIMGRLQIAQHSLYSSQALVSLLVAANKPRPGAAAVASSSSSENTLAPPLAARSASRAPSRAESPGANSSTGAPPSNAPDAAGRAHPPGSVAAVEAEFGLDPYSVALSGISRLEVTHPPPKDEDDDGEEDDDQDDDAAAGAEGANLPQFPNESERDEYAQRLQMSLAVKRASIQKSIDILRAGAMRLRGAASPSDGVEAAQDEGAHDGASSPSSSSSSSQRWRALKQAQKSGWKLTPGRPGRSAASRLGQDKGEQDDAWIGFGVPEARPLYRRAALAYLSHEDKGAETESDAKRLVFPARMRRRLRASVALKGGDEDAAKRIVSTDPWRDWHSSRKEGGHPESVDEALRTAQAELADRELFDQIRAQAGVLAARGLVPSQQSDHWVEVHVGAGMTLRFEMVEEGAGAGAEANGDASSTEAEAEVKRNSNGNGDNADGDGEIPSPAMLTLLLSFARLSLINSYKANARARAAAEKAAAAAAAAKARAKPGAGAGADGSASGSGSAAAQRPPKAPHAQQRGDATPKGRSAALPPPGGVGGGGGAGAAGAGVGAAPGHQDAWTQAPCLMPLLALLHYMSFVAQVRRVLAEVCRSDAERREAAAAAQREREREGRTGTGHRERKPAWFVLHGGESITQTETGRGMRGLAEALLEGSFSGSAGVGGGESGARSALEGLRGVGALMRGGRALAQVTLAYPSHLEVDLPFRATPSGRSGVRIAGVDLGALRGYLIDELEMDTEGEMEGGGGQD